ncbi:hypothetical protein FGG08_003223 [Glutinoglossum americanum]|uniref:Uncharacterized protein n=1 Tax=Glutinoglossum americanum TaxID=1670608 RepID=A0A9P8I313_9PEZI|nr:hypothetical protein FGG08_003223 [Glutinoglossum americanum]
MPATAPTPHATPPSYSPSIHDPILLSLYSAGWRLGSLTGRMNYMYRCVFFPPLTVVWVHERLWDISEDYRRGAEEEEDYGGESVNGNGDGDVAGGGAGEGLGLDMALGWRLQYQMIVDFGELNRPGGLRRMRGRPLLREDARREAERDARREAGMPRR